MQLSTISLALTRLGGAFDPSQLFAGGTVAGAWYDPSDLTTLFTTSAGTTQCAMPGQGSAVSVGRMLDKSGNGNHAISFNDTTARPELRARVNLLTYSEEFDNGAWVKFQSTISANTTATTDPLGGNTADKLIPNVGSTIPFVYNSAVASISGVQYTASVYVKAAELGFVFVVNNTRASSTQAGVCVNLSTGATSNAGANGTYVVSDAGNGWWRISATTTATSTSGYLEIWPMAVAGTGGYAGNGTSGIYIWAADLRPANIGANVPAYQRIADANTYDTSGFPLYLRFDGIDDSMYTPANLNLSGTDKVAVFAGVRKLSDAALFIAELSANTTLNNGSFGLYQSGATVLYGQRGTIFVDEPSAASYAAPTSVVVTGVGNISGDATTIRTNGIEVTDTSDLGAGNFGTYPLYIGARNNSSLWFNGQLYGFIAAGSAVSAGNISATEQYIANKTGIAI